MGTRTKAEHSGLGARPAVAVSGLTRCATLPPTSVSPEPAHQPSRLRPPAPPPRRRPPLPMFDTLSDRLRKTLARLTGRGRVTEADVDAAMREVRLALLEADVNFKVVKDFVARVRERAVGAEILESLTAGQQVVKIVHEELIALRRRRRPHVPSPGSPGGRRCSSASRARARRRPPPSSRATSSSRAAGRCSSRPTPTDRPPSTSSRRSASSLDIPVYRAPAGHVGARHRPRRRRAARRPGRDMVILDTAGRLTIDEALMAEIAASPTAVKPERDPARGRRDGRPGVGRGGRGVPRTPCPLTGLVLTKIDGDARGGAALSIGAVTGVPVKFLGTGERTDALEAFHPDRLAGRILGMGDVLTLVERAQENFDAEGAGQAGATSCARTQLHARGLPRRRCSRSRRWARSASSWR